MAKQTFTVGQVLTAAQMTSLQQTAMGGGSATAKTASYTLVAADAGTVVQMNSASATTITVNTALFAAGDTVQIQNIGAGVCTVTAGTATVSTSATLALKQYDAGSLYFNTTSAAIFFASDAADGSSPLTTKGDLYGFSTLDARIPIGTNNQVLTADSAQALGLKWATPASAAPTSGNASVLTFQTTTSLSYVDLATSGPACTVTTGTKALVIFGCNATNTSNGNAANRMDFAVSGATTRAATDDTAFLNTSGTINFQTQASRAITITGLTAGSNTFTAKYITNSGTAQFGNRFITVIDLGS